ncbi:fungal-specific transcription factor domain-containing protein [Fusarium tricinctum]|uniref:Fungal-specific transcription factor domain-containing protein n=1 Tax=Fusarium tricinctum TaxID=61284 RepID=A0A8K0RT00_9HYPO|nr:fungal-specific transcription factor domain-containing protein [Fusarium tricinctum]
MTSQPRNTTSCDECRRRKLRCDAQQPRCGFCLRSNLACEASSRGKRGPKRGHLNALRSRLGQLEEMLQGRVQSPVVIGNVQPMPAIGTQEVTFGNFDESQAVSEFEIGLSIDLTVHVELDQLYFDRVHPSFPILHQRSYMAWSRSSTKSTTRLCLQRIMWILAILLSTQFRDMIEPLYKQVKRDLELIDCFEVENVQAWTLLTVCELMRASYSQAWISAGRVFRLVQALRYHEIDTPDKHNRPQETIDNQKTEEKRRVFWMAYFLDHLFSLRNDWPVTLNEHTICTKLPIPDEEFQAGRIASGVFLSQAIAEPTPKQPLFNKCLVLVTLCGRVLLRNRHETISKAYGDCETDPNGHWNLLENIVATRNRMLSHGDSSDPLGTLAIVLGQVVELLFYKGIIKPADNSCYITKKCCAHALIAVGEIIRLAKGLKDQHVSKVHPMMPMSLFFAAEFLYENRKLGNSVFLAQLRPMIEALGNLRNVNNHEKSYLDLLPHSCISASLGVLEHSKQ